MAASPAYLKKCKQPETPQDLLEHRLLAFSRWKSESSWGFAHANGNDKETLTFHPYLSMNDYAGLAPALLASGGIGDLPPVVQPELVRPDEAEARVVLRVAFEEQNRLAEPARSVERGTDERGADPLPLELRQNADRTELEQPARGALEADPAREDMSPCLAPGRGFVGEGYKGQ